MMFRFFRSLLVVAFFVDSLRSLSLTFPFFSLTKQASESNEITNPTNSTKKGPARTKERNNKARQRYVSSGKWSKGLPHASNHSV